MRSQLTSLSLQLLQRARTIPNITFSPAITRHLADISSKHPIEDLTNSQLKQQTGNVSPMVRSESATISQDNTSEATAQDELIKKAQIVFGSRLVGPAERREQLELGSTMIAGIKIPPKPEEPDNCCMGGCVNCVWDRYRDEMEEWAAKSAEAQTKIAAESKSVARISVRETDTNLAMSMDDDGGGSESNWSSSDSNADIFEGIPVGIREFMKTEKKLKDRHRAESIAG